MTTKTPGPAVPGNPATPEWRSGLTEQEIPLAKQLLVYLGSVKENADAAWSSASQSFAEQTSIDTDLADGYMAAVEQRIAIVRDILTEWRDLKRAQEAAREPERATAARPIAGYQTIVCQEGVCGGRPTLLGHRLEPWHFMGWSKERVLQTWDYVDPGKIEEAFRFLAENRAWCIQLAREATGKA